MLTVLWMLLVSQVVQAGTISEVLPTSGSKTVPVAIQPGITVLLLDSPTKGSWKVTGTGSPGHLLKLFFSDPPHPYESTLMPAHLQVPTTSGELAAEGEALALRTYWKYANDPDTAWRYWPAGLSFIFPIPLNSTTLYSGSADVDYKFEFQTASGLDAFVGTVYLTFETKWTDNGSQTYFVNPGMFVEEHQGSPDVFYSDVCLSYRFVDAWERNGGASALGWPVSDNGASPGVHNWNGFYVQNFNGGTYGSSIVMYDERSDRYAELDMFGDGSGIPAEGWGHAYLIRTGFWEWYRYNNGITRLKAPISDEVGIPGGAKQEFRCGWLEYSATTGSVSVWDDFTREGCGPISPPSTAGECFVGPTLQITGGTFVEPTENTIYCSAGPIDTLIEITGPIEDGLWGSAPTGYPVYLEYGSNSDGWSPYTSGKPKKTYIGDYTATGDPMTYSMTVGTYVQEMNFFLYEPATSDVEWFDIESWRIVGDCYLDGTVMNQIGMSYPEADGEITCTLTEDDLIVDITGPVQALLTGWSVFEPTEIQYGSNTDGWGVPYTIEKVSEPWTGAYTYTIVLDPNVYDFNFFLTNGTSGEWFDLVDADWDGDEWEVGGDCWLNGSAITHAAPPSAPAGTIDCEVAGPDMTITISGSIIGGIFGNPPQDNPTYLEYGSNTDGWSPYTSGKPKKTWYPSFDTYQMIVGANVNEMNFFLYGTQSQQVNWFDLTKWTVTGDCYLDGTLVKH